MRNDPFPPKTGNKARMSSLNTAVELKTTKGNEKHKDCKGRNKTAMIVYVQNTQN